MHDRFEPVSFELTLLSTGENVQAMLGAIFIVTFFVLLISYFLILKWVIKGNLDLPKNSLDPEIASRLIETRTDR